MNIPLFWRIVLYIYNSDSSEETMSFKDAYIFCDKIQTQSKYVYKKKDVNHHAFVLKRLHRKTYLKDTNHYGK